MSTTGLFEPAKTIAEVEDLEVRRLMSSVTLENGILVVTGDEGKANTITLTVSQGKVQATAGRAKLAAAVAKVLAVSIAGGAKADVIDVSPLVKLGVYIDGRAGNDVIRTGAGNDTVVAGSGDDRVTNRGGKDTIFGGAGRNTVQATKRDVVYAGAGKSVVTGGATNRSLKEKDPVIPPPPGAVPPAPVVVTPVTTPTTPPTETPTGDANEPGGVDVLVGGGSNPPQPPAQQQQDPSGPQDPQPPVANDPQPPAVNDPQPPAVNDPQPPAVVDTTVGPTLNARDFGAKLDGVTDDTAAIQAALDALPATGGTLVLDGVAGIGKQGVHVRGKDHVTIKGTAAGAGFKALEQVTLQSVGGFSYIMVALYGCTNATVNGLKFDGSGLANAGLGLDRCSDTTVSGDEFVASGGGNGALVSEGGNRNKYLNNYVHDTVEYARGMWLGNVHDGELEHDAVVEGNTILRAAVDGIAGHHVGTVIRGNVIRDCGASGIALGAYVNPTNGYVAVTADVLIEDNVITGCAWHGIQSDVFAGQEYTQRVTIRGNFVADNAQAGIYALRSRGWVITGNTVQDNGVGITLGRTYDAVIQGNKVLSTHGAGKLVQSDGIYAVSNGTLAGDAAATAAGDTMTLENIVIDGNTCTGNQLSGIKVGSMNGGSADGITVTGNTCTDNVWDGLYINAPAGGPVKNVTVTGNTTSGNGRINSNVTL